MLKVINFINLHKNCIFSNFRDIWQNIFSKITFMPDFIKISDWHFSMFSCKTVALIVRWYTTCRVIAISPKENILFVKNFAQVASSSKILFPIKYYSTSDEACFSTTFQHDWPNICNFPFSIACECSFFDARDHYLLEVSRFPSLNH